MPDFFNGYNRMSTTIIFVIFFICGNDLEKGVHHSILKKGTHEMREFTDNIVIYVYDM